MFHVPSLGGGSLQERSPRVRGNHPRRFRVHSYVLSKILKQGRQRHPRESTIFILSLERVLKRVKSGRLVDNN